MNVTFPEHFTADQISRITSDDKFIRYVDRLDENFVLGTVSVTGVDWFGKRPGFIHVFSDVTDTDGNRIPGCGMLRGDGVGILLVLNLPESERNPATPFAQYTVLVEQGRTPVGETIFEIPAGSLDKGLDPIETALIEIREEVDNALVFEAKDLRVLYEGYASPGGSDELITIVAVESTVTSQYVQALHGALTGAADEDESIRVHVLPLHELPNKVKDLKSRLAHALFMGK